MKYVDMHCDTITSLYDVGGSLKHNDLHIDITKLQKGECLLQNFAIFTNIGKHDSSYTYKAIDYYHKQLEINSEYIKPVYKYEDIANNNCINAMLTLEDGSVVDGDYNNLERFYDLGVRMIALNWNYPNGIGYPNIDATNPNKTVNDINTQDGLTEFGKQYVRRCNELGIIVDVSHLSDKGFYDVLDICKGPFVASHSNARSICKAGRNMSDDMIRKLADKGGVLGLNFCSAFIEDNNETYTTIDNMVKHIRYIVDIGGVDCIGLGTDFDGIHNEIELKDASGMQLLFEALSKYYTQEQLEKIFYKNILRVYKECLK